MGEAARVLDASALEETKAAIADHAETIKSILIGVEADVQRLDNWLGREMPAFWKRRVRELEEEVVRAKSKIATKRLAAAPEPASVVEETIALRKVTAQLEHARAKMAKVKHWSIRWRTEAPLYRAACRSITDWANRDAPLAMIRLTLMLKRLDEYHQLSPMKPGDPPPLGSDFIIDPEEDAARAAAALGEQAPAAPNFNPNSSQGAAP